jgi:hypothetical protein
MRKPSPAASPVVEPKGGHRKWRKRAAESAMAAFSSSNCRLADTQGELFLLGSFSQELQEGVLVCLLSEKSSSCFSSFFLLSKELENALANADKAAEIHGYGCCLAFRLYFMSISSLLACLLTRHSSHDSQRLSPIGRLLLHLYFPLELPKNVTSVSVSENMVCFSNAFGEM